MHLHCNGIKYNVSKGPAAHGGEVLDAIWHRMETWQGRAARCSHDVAAVKKREIERGDGTGSKRGNVKGMLQRFFSMLLLLFFNHFIYFTN